ncbi:MAG: beta-ketoacyl-ACP synthase II [Candidatus Ozemobacteraceae bacterium]
MKIVITGIGLVTPLGSSIQEVVDRLEVGECAAKPPTRFDSSPFACHRSAEVEDFDPGRIFGEDKTLRLMNRDAQFAVAAARLALSDARLIIGDSADGYPADEVALFGATGLAGIALEEVLPLIRHSATPDGKFDPRRFGERALHRVRPILSFKILSNMPICFVSIFEGIKGRNAVFNPWEGQGAAAIRAGCDALFDGDAQCALVGGCDLKTHELAFISLQQQGAFTHSREIRPLDGPIPEVCHDEGLTKGFPAEGAAFLVLEREERARARGARIYARLTPIAHAHTHERLIERVSSLVAAEMTLISADDGDGRFAKAEKVLGASRTIVPKSLMGNLYAAAAAVQIGIGAALAAGKGSLEQASRGLHENRVLSICSGMGDEQAAFLLESVHSRNDTGTVNTVNTRTRHRVVVTGIGIVGPQGIGCEPFWEGLLAGRPGPGPITLFDVSTLPVRIGAEVRGFDAGQAVRDFPGADRERDRKVRLGLVAAREALAHARLEPGDPAFSEAMVSVGVSLEVFFLEDVTPFTSAPDIVQAMATGILGAGTSASILQTPLDRLTRLIGDRYRFGGTRLTNCSACAAGAQTIGETFRRLRAGDASLALAGAADSMLNPLGLGGFSLLRALSTKNEQPEKACRPFDADRDGTVLGEGAAFLVLETLEHARSRGVPILAEIVGYGSSLDAYRVSDPDPEGRGAVLSMRKAIADAHLTSDDIDCINAHGTGTPKNDLVETLAIKQVLGERAGRVPVHAVKSMTGHCIAASGAIEAAVSVLTLSRGIIPPTINLDNPDPACDLDYVPKVARLFTGRTVLSNSFGFGGQNGALLFRKFEETHHDEHSKGT